jgi:hypothetical protein
MRAFRFNFVHYGSRDHLFTTQKMLAMKLNLLSLHTTFFFLWSKYIDNFTRFRFVRFRFVAFRFYFVSHITGTLFLFMIYNAIFCIRKRCKLSMRNLISQWTWISKPYAAFTRHSNSIRIIGCELL